MYSLQEMSVDDLIDPYETTMSDLPDKHYPVVKVCHKFGLLTPWFDAECRQSRRYSRMLERRYRRTRSDTDRLAWVQQLKTMHEETTINIGGLRLLAAKRTRRNFGAHSRVLCGKRRPERKTTATQRTTSRTSSPTRSKRSACQLYLCRLKTPRARRRIYLNNFQR